MATDDLARRGYEGELRRHRENLQRALSEVRFVLESLERQSGSAAGLTSEARQLLAAAGDAAQEAAALSAADQLSFGFDQP